MTTNIRSQPPTPYDPAKWVLIHNGQQVVGDRLGDVFRLGQEMRTHAEKLVAAENLMRAIEVDLAEAASEERNDTARMDWLEAAVENGCVTMCFEMDGGVHITLDGVGEDQEAYRNQNSIRAGIDAALVRGGNT